MALVHSLLARTCQMWHHHHHPAWNDTRQRVCCYNSAVGLCSGISTRKTILCRSQHRHGDSSNENNNNNNDKPVDDLDMYFEAEISEVRTAEGQGNVIFLRLLDGHNSILPVYIGEYECGALIKEMHKKAAPRPGTHDLLKNTVEAIGYRVTQVRITSLVGNIYHARIQMVSSDGSTAVDIDSRPSDAINMAARFRSPIYVNKDIASRMAHPTQAHEPSVEMGHHARSHSPEDTEMLKKTNEIINSCKEEILLYNDPTMIHKLQMQLAIAEELFEDATKIRDVIDKLLGSDRSLSLIIAIETALEDQRLEEAARLRDELRALRRQHLQSE